MRTCHGAPQTHCPCSPGRIVPCLPNFRRPRQPAPWLRCSSCPGQLALCLHCSGSLGHLPPFHPRDRTNPACASSSGLPADNENTHPVHTVDCYCRSLKALLNIGHRREGVRAPGMAWPFKDCMDCPVTFTCGACWPFFDVRSSESDASPIFACSLVCLTPLNTARTYT